jgi:hypothetical protein
MVLDLPSLVPLFHQLRLVINYFRAHKVIAGVVELVDALDSKSSGACPREGSTPSSGTRTD